MKGCMSNLPSLKAFDVQDYFKNEQLLINV